MLGLLGDSGLLGNSGLLNIVEILGSTAIK
jgi:hypothetical protein